METNRDEIEKHIQALKNEIASAVNEADQTEQLERLAEVARAYDGEDKIIPSTDILERMKNGPAEKQYMSGIKPLDDILGGFREKQVIVVSAATKSGKTSLCMYLTEKMDTNKVLWFPFEESAEELLQKYLDREQEPPLFWTPGVMRGDRLEWLEKKIIEGRAKFDTRVVFIDHLHFIVPLSSERLDIRIGQTMRELKRMAKTWNIIIFIIAHMKQPRMLEQPTIDDIRDSSFVAQEADSVLMLWRKTKKVKGEVEITNQVNLSVQANRRTGKTGNIKLIYGDGKFLEADWKHEEPKQNGEW